MTRWVIRFEFKSGARRWNAPGGLVEDPRAAFKYATYRNALARVRSLRKTHLDKPYDQWCIVARVPAGSRPAPTPVT